ncbi:lipid A-modifier LpxR family protein [Tropicibacter naphthalenivorans]|uniref:Lipid A deacylase LpxR family protein n=1 Tax=Tropicibacter naphthalenivorans TaxID=441103 RepID=A0A0P1GDP4_9RHOB|nr:lipid A-modifier LpxR family protein [Tropicibacter naphthalenivorans]CUH79451.1 hypothetical protein TRN7648_02478 [Tropicibacter naphthalenivorans]SMC72349.1 hypothetical protein SAMN04488093_103108 [Tropicibacter naphthalenivorans]
MIRVIAMAALAMIAPMSDAAAQGREVLGNGRIVNNDLYGDASDRWQTGSVAGSHVVGYGWTGMLPDRPFDILEYRIGGQVVTPANLRTPDPTDRPYAGVWTLGAHTHFQRGMVEMAMGADLAIVGQQTGLSDLQTALHDGLGVTAASKQVTDNQVGDGFYPTLVTEAATTIPLGGQAVVRPFVEGRWGLETLARVGADVTIGGVGQGELLVRDAITGQRYRTVTQPIQGFSYVLGGDFAYVDSSELLPANKVTATDTRTRLRAGVHWQGERNTVFYGVTYLSKEFEAQPKGQVVGSVRMKLDF